ncbi:hypothetical protein OSTOST_14542 [Ostertagia ostertagi]
MSCKWRFRHSPAVRHLHRTEHRCQGLGWQNTFFKTAHPGSHRQYRVKTQRTTSITFPAHGVTNHSEQ